jgi:hypothetical protein
MAIQIGHIELDVSTVAKQLRQDFRDDWFPDPVGYNDLFESDVIEEVIAKNYGDHHGVYVPSKAQLLNVPKANFTLRYALETSVADRAVYQVLASDLLPYFDPLITWHVFSHRQPKKTLEDTRIGSKYLFRNGITAWSDFLGCVEASLSPGSVLLSTDLANYFENINIDILREKFISYIPEISADANEKARVRGKVDQLFQYVRSWCFQADRGLPQNRDASSFLANIYMRDVDQHMIGRDFQYFRYMDDIKVVCSSRSAARKALKELVLALRPLGQFVNSGKTKIVEASDLEGLRECLASGSVEMKRIATAWNTKSLKPISRTFIPLKNLLIKTLNEERFDSREFRFCISRMETLARCREFEVPATYFEAITNGIISGLDVAPVATDQMTRYLRCVPLSEVDFANLRAHVLDEDRTIYNWKNYRIWLLLTQRQHTHPDLHTRAQQILASRADDPTRAGATLYLGAFGSKADREAVAVGFASLQSYLGQRTAILAVQELHFRGKAGGVSIEQNVAPFLRADLRGTYNNLNRAGHYFSELEPLSVTKYVDLERDYA